MYYFYVHKCIPSFYSPLVLNDTFVPFLSSLRRNSSFFFFFLLTTHHIPSNFVHRIKRGNEDNSTMRIGKIYIFSTQLFMQLNYSSLVRIPLSLHISHCFLWFPFSLFLLRLKIFVFDYVRPFLIEKRRHFSFVSFSALSFSYPIFSYFFFLLVLTEDKKHFEHNNNNNNRTILLFILILLGNYQDFPLLF